MQQQQPSQLRPIQQLSQQHLMAQMQLDVQQARQPIQTPQHQHQINTAMQQQPQLQYSASVGQPSPMGGAAPLANQMPLRQQQELQQLDSPDESIHRLTFDHRINSIGFQNTQDANTTFAVGSMIMDRVSNKVEVFRLKEATTISNEQPQQPLTTKRLVKVLEFPHEYPPSKIVWEPSLGGNLMATAGECVKIWMLNDQSAKLLWDVKQATFGGAGTLYDAPVTSFDWSPVQTNMLATAQLNGICSVWDLHYMHSQQLIAHESQVNSIAFTSENNQFVTGGQEGQARFFDLRNLQTSTIIYQQSQPVLQVLINRVNQYQLALVLENSFDVVILDIRNSTVPQSTLHHNAQVNYAAWYPTQNVISTTSDDAMTKIFDLNNSAVIGVNAHMSQPVQGPKCYQYFSDGPINQLCWSNSSPHKWLGMTLDNQVQLLKC